MTANRTHEAGRKYSDLAQDLRERAAMPAFQFQRDEMLALAAHLERLAKKVALEGPENISTLPRLAGSHDALRLAEKLISSVA